MEQIPEKNKNDLTIKTYQENFDVYTEGTVSEVKGEVKIWIDSFLNKLPHGAKILEIGSATGRDARYFASQGFDVTCADIIPQALTKLQVEGFKTEYFDFRNEPKKEWLDSFDGYFANGVFVHAPVEIFEKNLENISKIVHHDGIIGLSFKPGEGEDLSEDKVNAPRYFKYYTEEILKQIISKYPLEILELVYTNEGKWLRVILKNK